MAEQGRNKPRGRGMRVDDVPKKRRIKKMTVPQPKPTKRQRKKYHNRADTLLGHIDQVMNPGKIYRTPGTRGVVDDRIVPALSEALLGTGRFVGDKIKGMRGMSAGGSLKTKGIDGIAKRGKTRARRG